MTNSEQFDSDKFSAIAKENMSVWFKRLETRNPQEVADLYTVDATFLPTLLGEFKRGKKGAEEYFEHFLAKNPKGRVVEEVISPTSDDSYLHVGMYDFILDGDSRRVTAHGRFDYHWKKMKNGKWMISHHHSSIKPE